MQEVLGIVHAKKLLKRIILLIFIQLSFTSFSQQPFNEGGYWFYYFGDNKINERIGVHSEVQLRNLGVKNALSTSFFRVGLNVYTTKTSILTGGYGLFYNAPSKPFQDFSTSKEHRAWQQFLMRRKTNYTFLEHRYRQEQRFVKDLESEAWSNSHRARYRFQAIFPFYTLSPYLRYFFMAFYNETMLNFKPNPADVFDRNRLYFALGIQVSPKLNFQFGYLNQLAQQAQFPNHEISHLLQIGVSYNMDDLMRSFFAPIKTENE